MTDVIQVAVTDETVVKIVTAPTAGPQGVPGIVAASAPATYNPMTQTVGVAVGATAGTVAAGNDPRLSDQRVPTDGSVTEAKLAFAVATQAELDAEAAARSAADTAEANARTAADALLVPLTQKGAANGVATLDAAGTIPLTQFPASIATQAELDAEAAARGADITAEATARANADATEAAARSSADTAEATTRAANDLAIVKRTLTSMSEVLPLIAWDSFDRPDNYGTGQGRLGTADSGHVWIDVTEPVGGWGADRPRYFGIRNRAAHQWSAINAGFACAVLDDDEFVLDRNQRPNQQLLFKDLNGANGADTGLMLRFIDGDNWIAVAVSNSTRIVTVRQCKAGVLTDLATGAQWANSFIGDWTPMRMYASVGIAVPNTGSGVLAVECSVITQGVLAGVRHRILETADAAWFTSLLAARRVGIFNGDIHAGFSVGKLKGA